MNVTKNVTKKMRRVVLAVVALVLIAMTAINTSNLYAQSFVSPPPAVPAQTTNNVGGSECTPSSWSAVVDRHDTAFNHNRFQDFVQARSWISVCGPQRGGFDEVGFRFVLPVGATVPNGNISLAVMGLNGCELENDTGVNDAGDLIINISCNVDVETARYNAETGLHSVYMRVKLPTVDNLGSLTDSVHILSYYQASQGFHRGNISEREGTITNIR